MTTNNHLTVKQPESSQQESASGGNALTVQTHSTIFMEISCTLPQAELAKLYRMIETALPDKTNRIVQFFSAYENEGAGTIAFETAVAAARLIGRRVLYVDTSATKPGFPRKLPDSLGLSLDLLLLTGRPAYEAIVQIAGTDLYFAMLRERQADEFSSASIGAIEKAFETLSHEFDLIIIDSQGIIEDSFGMAMARLADGSVIVVEAERTRLPVAVQSKRLIESGGGRVIGAILNKRRFYIPRLLYRLLYRRSVI